MAMDVNVAETATARAAPIGGVMAMNGVEMIGFTSGKRTSRPAR
jgi:hypothetical protein